MVDSTNSGSRRGSAEHPSMVGGHAKYIAGAASALLGYQSGEQQKREAVEEMKAASEQSSSSEQQQQQPMQSTILGTVEKKIGELTGCEGLEKEGEERIPAKAGIEETSGTG